MTGQENWPVLKFFREVYRNTAYNLLKGDMCYGKSLYKFRKSKKNYNY